MANQAAKPDGGAPPGSASSGPSRLPSADEIAQIQQHPNFPTALRALLAGMVELYQSNRLINRLINDRARLVFGMQVLDLHNAGPPGFTMTQAQDLCVSQGLCSAGRTSALIALMRFAGYLELLPPAADRRVRLYGVTDKLIATHHARWRRVFAALALIRPEGAAALAALDRPEFTRAYIQLLARDYRAGVRVLADRAPDLELFAERNSGILILFSLIADAPADDTVPPNRPIPVSVSALARRFAVSRAHVLKLIRDAASEGHFSLDSTDGHQVTFTPRLQRAVRNFIATCFVYLAQQAGAAVAEIDANR